MVVNDVLLSCNPMVMATVSTIDDYGFSFNYVGRGNTTDNTYQSLYDFVIYIYTFTRIDLYKYDDDMMVCGIVTSSTVTTSLRSVIDTPVASIMILNLWAVTPRQRLRTMMMMMMYYISRYVYIYKCLYVIQYKRD